MKRPLLRWRLIPLLPALLFSCTLFSDPVELGNTFYIDPVLGSIDGDGSAESPWRTLEEAVDAGEFKCWEYTESYPDESTPLQVKNPEGRIKSGDRVILREGNHGALSFRGYFTRELTIEAEEGARAVLTGIELTAASGIRLSGLEIRPDTGYTE